MNDISYYNDMLVRLEELLFHELSGCAAWKVELVGVDFIQSKDIHGNTAEEVIENCIQEIEAAGLVEELDYALGGKGVKLELHVKGCVHLPKESRLKKDGVQPYICPITNMLQDQLIEKLNYETCYLGEVIVHNDTGTCRTRSAVYETIDKIGEVCNWDEE